VNTTVANATPEEPQATPARVRKPTETTDWCIQKYLALRAKLEARQKEQALELAPFKLAMATLENWMLDDLGRAKVNSMRGEQGTCYLDKRTSATVEDWGKLLDYIRENGAWDLLERRVSKLAAEAILEETKQAVPGVKHDREVVLKVRRS